MQGPLSLKNKMLSQPLLNLSKSSTPIRTRIVSSQSILNSTPINQLKLGGIKSSSIQTGNVNNKQNTNNLNTAGSQPSGFKSNYQSYLNLNNSAIKNDLSGRLSNNSRYEQNKSKEKQMFKNYTNINIERNNSLIINKPISLVPSTDKKNDIETNRIENLQFRNGTANLSPIMALNRKMNQGPLNKLGNFRSFTPNNLKRDDSSLDISRDHHHEGIKSNSMIFQQKSNPTQNLRISNSFTNLLESRSKMLESRSKTPTRLGSMAFSSLSKRNSENSSALKQSLSTNNFFSAYTPQTQSHNLINSNSKNSLKNSKTFGQSFNLSGLNSPTQYSTIKPDSYMCAKNHNKKAKYRIITDDNSELMYCSGCAVDLVQKGFTVQELDANNSMSDMGSPKSLSSLLKSPNSHYNSSPNNPLISSKQSFKAKFSSFKSSTPNTQINSQQIYYMAQSLQSQLTTHLTDFERKEQILNSKFTESAEQIDCYYNSLIEHIQSRKQKDKSRLSQLKQSIEGQLLMDKKNDFYHYLQKLEYFFKNKNYNHAVKKEIQQIQDQLIQYSKKQHQNNNSMLNGIYQNQTQVVQFEIPMQEQFNNFGNIFDKQLTLDFKLFPERLNYSNNVQANFSSQSSNFNLPKPFQQKNSPNPPSSSALRFSFEKALQSQQNKKNFLQSKMNPLEQQQQQYYEQQQQDLYHQQMNSKPDPQYIEQNSFNYENMNKNDGVYYSGSGLQNPLNYPDQQPHQKPFRTLFADEDDICLDQEEQDQVDENIQQYKSQGFKNGQGKKNIYSPTFKVI